MQRAVLGFGGYLAITSGACKRPRTPAAPDAGAAPPLESSGLRSLTAAQYMTLAAACERILPRDQDPGATDLGCALYIDRALAEPDAHALFGRALLGGLKALDNQSLRRFQGPFAEATAAQQDQLLGEWQVSKHSGETAFFEVLHALTMEGAFGDPSHGGNKDGQGFAMVGFWPPPPTPGVPLTKLKGG